MKKAIFKCAVCFCLLTSMTPVKDEAYGKDEAFNDDKKFPSLLSSDRATAVTNWVDSLYNTMHLDSLGLAHNVFFSACKGYEYLLSKNRLNKNLLTICDYSQSSKSKRLYVLDMANAKLLFNTYVSHGRNSGAEYATSFSNRSDSHKSSLGFLITAETYFGKNGYSMRFNGQENFINTNVRSRDIVMHGSRYVNSQRADEGSMMGRSYGCPAIPYSECDDIIDCIKGGSCFFIYSNDKTYSRNSQILNARFEWPVANNNSFSTLDIKPLLNK